MTNRLLSCVIKGRSIILKLDFCFNAIYYNSPARNWGITDNFKLLNVRSKVGVYLVLQGIRIVKKTHTCMEVQISQ